MQAEDNNALAANKLSTKHGAVQEHGVEAGPFGGVAPPCPHVPSANTSDGERSTSEISEGPIPAPHLGVASEEGAAQIMVHDCYWNLMFF